MAESKPTGAELATASYNLLGMFARVQTVIDDLLAETFFRQVIPETADIVISKVVSRIRDTERPALVLAIARDLKSDAELDDFSSQYASVKRLRDSIAHESVFQVGRNGDMLSMGVGVVNANKPSRPPAVPSLEELREASRACEWLVAQVTYVLASAYFVQSLYLGDQSYEAIKPTRLAKDWNGELGRPK